MFEAIALFLITASYTAGYFVSLYSMAVYVDPDELNDLAPGISEGRRHFLETLAKNPRASLQVATVFKSFQLVLVSVLSGLLLQQMAVRSELTVHVLFPVGFAVVWLLQILFVEFLPRRHARTAVSPSMLKHLWLIRLVHWLFLPIVGGYRRILRRTDDEPVSEEEKEDIIERAIETLADQAGIDERIVEEDEKQMIGQIFQLDQTVVREIMVPRIKVAGIERNMTFKQIQQLVVEDGHSRFPVFEETIDRVIGILYVKDLFNNMPGAGEEFVIARYLRKPFFVPEGKVIGELLREFKTRKQHIALVVDEYGGLAGLVTLEDILEEIVGDIQDEHDPDELQLLVRTEDGYLVDASMLVSDLQEVLDTEHEQGDYDTVGGLMYHLFGEVPRQGQRTRWHDIHFEIVTVEGHRIRQVRVRHRNGVRVNGSEE
ncbi:hemolysin family protein [bacterium]|nr:hemolysin family protein [bacterium]